MTTKNENHRKPWDKKKISGWIALAVVVLAIVYYFMLYQDIDRPVGKKVITKDFMSVKFKTQYGVSKENQKIKLHKENGQEFQFSPLSPEDKELIINGCSANLEVKVKWAIDIQKSTEKDSLYLETYSLAQPKPHGDLNKETIYQLKKLDSCINKKINSYKISTQNQNKLQNTVEFKALEQYQNPKVIQLLDEIKKQGYMTVVQGFEVAKFINQQKSQPKK